MKCPHDTRCGYEIETLAALRTHLVEDHQIVPDAAAAVVAATRAAIMADPYGLKRHGIGKYVEPRAGA